MVITAEQLIIQSPQEEELKVDDLSDQDSLFHKLKDKFMVYFKADEVLKAYKLIQDMKRFAEEGKLDRAQVNDFMETEEIKIVCYDQATLDEFMEALNGIENGTDESWTRHKQTDDMKLFYKMD